MNWPRLFGALESRNYRLYFFGQIVSLIGTWMTQTASLWLVYHLTSSPFMLGVVAFVGQLPIFILSPFTGVLADRVNRHRLLIITQILSMLQSLALAALTFTNHIDINILVGLTLLQGLINAVDLPVRQALVVSFVENRKYLGNAIALNSSVFNLARLIGPALSGFIIASAGVAACYLIDGISYLAVIISLLAMRFALLPKVRVPKHPLVEMRDGFHYTFSHRPIRALIVTLALISFVGFSYTVLTPMFARDIFGGDAKTLGYLMSATGVGAVIGAVYLGARKEIRGLGNVMAWGGALMGIGTIAFASSRFLSLALLSLGIVGLGGVLMMASGNTLLQSLVEEEKRGRVMSIFTMAFTGTMPLGNLAIGAIAGKFGAPLALILSGIFCVIVAIMFYRKIPELRAAAAPMMKKLEVIDVPQ
jgi:MFS family permease